MNHFLGNALTISNHISEDRRCFIWFLLQVNSSLLCFYDRMGVKQAQLTVLNLSETGRTFKLWCFATTITSIASVLFMSYCIMVFFKKFHRFIESRHRVTAQIAMQPINFA